MLRYEAKKYIKSGRTLGMFSLRVDRPQQLHCHDFIELVYITSGSALQQVKMILPRWLATATAVPSAMYLPGLWAYPPVNTGVKISHCPGKAQTLSYLLFCVTVILSQNQEVFL